MTNQMLKLGSTTQKPIAGTKKKKKNGRKNPHGEKRKTKADKNEIVSWDEWGRKK